jgi:7-carboxy-7-deazaguanine synthase
MLSVCEVFKSIQGESSFAGLPCSFIRLQGCNLRCRWCDTTYAWDQGQPRTVAEVVEEVCAHETRYVELTGGEPLLQSEAPRLCTALLDKGKTVLVETNGSTDISLLPREVRRIMDVKCPSSGMVDTFRFENLDVLTTRDELKFVLASREDFDWAFDFVKKHELLERLPIIFSPVFTELAPEALAQWILQSGETIRLGLQLHKYIWPPQMRGV